MTIIDGLTQALNKRYFLEFLESEIARCTRHQRPLSLVMFDIDHFKKINDEHGHLTGDYVLRELARRVRTRVRKEEVFARYGGEEFALTLPETSRDQSMKVGGRSAPPGRRPIRSTSRAITSPSPSRSASAPRSTRSRPTRSSRWPTTTCTKPSAAAATKSSAEGRSR